jgi:hypothetical protein
MGCTQFVTDPLKKAQADRRHPLTAQKHTQRQEKNVSCQIPTYPPTATSSSSSRKKQTRKNSTSSFTIRHAHLDLPHLENKWMMKKIKQ